ncbi:hypothetical protein [Flavobacterium ajazii]|nr:hypothetical protein [Flavobacterium ajazii]
MLLLNNIVILSGVEGFLTVKALRASTLVHPEGSRMDSARQ